jgi:hypothetical protein
MIVMCYVIATLNVIKIVPSSKVTKEEGELKLKLICLLVGSEAEKFRSPSLSLRSSSTLKQLRKHSLIKTKLWEKKMLTNVA